MKSRSPAPLWRQFDATWYRATYKDILGDAYTLPDKGLKLWYETYGEYSGHSPNRYFDEIWYRLNCPAACQDIASQTYRCGFEHYCLLGHRTQSPHYLFSERHYTQQNPDLSLSTLLSQGFSNGYDHYLRKGDQEHKSGHVFFDPALYQKHRPALAELAHLSPFHHFLHMDRSLPDRMPLSENFDPAWYARLKPEAQHRVEAGYSPNLLFVFLESFSPNAF